MPVIHFVMKNGEMMDVDAPNGLSVMEIARKAGINEVEGACGGSLACATCHLIIHPDWYDKLLPAEGDITEDEEDMLDLAFDLRNTSRLSCQIMMSDDLNGLIVALPGSKTEW